MALTGVDMDVSVSVLTVTVDDVFAVEGSVFVQRLVRPKADGIDSQRRLLAVSQQASDRRFVCGFRRHHVAVVGSAIRSYRV